MAAAVIAPAEEDLPYEEDVLRNPFSLKSWWRYIEFRRESPQRIRNIIYERALRELPGSYKLWHNYLRERVTAVRGKPVVDPVYESVNNAFERSLVFMHKMPRIWIEYCTFLCDQERITRTRHTFDRALRSLPITQHDRVWKPYLKFIQKINIPHTAVRVYRRYLKLEPNGVEEYIDYLISVNYIDEAARLLARAVNDDSFESRQGKTKHQLWLQLCDVICKYPKEIKSLKVDAIIRGGLRKFTDEVGKLWTSLAEYYIQLAQFEKARDIFEEAVNTVNTVRDFSHIWDAYTQFEDSMMPAKMDMLAQAEGDELEEETADFELTVARYEHLLDRQRLLLSSVLLRQNPHNVHEWHKRVKLFTGNPKKIVETYTTALTTVDPLKAKGKPHTLWVGFARFYENHNKLEEARTVFEKATQVNYRTIDELASLWCDYAEMEIRHKNYDIAHSLLQRATVSPRRMVAVKEDDPVQKRLFKSVKLWSFYVDLDECLGAFDTTKAIYDKIIELRVATPQIVLNYATFLEEHKHFEESFKAYEKGIALFNFPYVHDIWVVYLTKFVLRYGGDKLERARDLFEQVLEKVPAKESKFFFVMFAHLEEEHGLARHAMAIYDRACRTVAEEDRYAMYLLYLSRATEFFGVTHTREIYAKAIENLPEKYIKNMCLRFADVERKLGEIDRARAIYTHGAQYSDPRTEKGYWDAWTDFEKKHGNEETFREALRIRRSIQAQYNTQINVMSAQMLAASKAAEAEDAKHAANEMEAIERRAAALQQKSAPRALPTVRQDIETQLIEEVSAPNPEEIVIREPGEEEEDLVEVEEMQVPNAVFGGIKDAAEVGKRPAEDEDNSGALARIKRKRQ